ncbi:sucrase ferredoxin [Aeromicrobium sp.]|uniref:sucrase ferredoxin n=1 Tax=Aeromicrobium sp. TaxID=1871063 RepID=UPI003D6C0708
MPPAPQCADTARERGDPMHGTALNVRRFLLIEHPGPWPFDALRAIRQDIHDLLVAATNTAGSRTLLIRRHGRATATPERAWAVADVIGGRIRWGTWGDDSDLLDAHDALSEPTTSWSDEPVLLVCTHGRHDTCCAVRGRPVAAALAERHGDRVWECSHVGGDRFAPTVVVLPDGTYYGGLDDDDAGDIIDRHLDGTVTPSRLRGSSLFAPVAQAAAVAVHERFGPGGARDVTSANVETTDRGRWRVELRCTGRLPERVVVEVEARQSAPAMLTCRAVKPSSARTFEVTGLRAV